jgi:hypothetical protein
MKNVEEVLQKSGDITSALFSDKILTLELKELKILKSRLDELCLDFDPFNPILNDDTQELLKIFKLQSVVENPFTFTNILLKSLDFLENEIKRRNEN